jgi:4-hydroxybenzoate polyprenyltransferase
LTLREEAQKKAKGAADATGAAVGNEGVAFLMKSSVAVAAIFTALGVSGGLLGNMARNHPKLTAIAIVGASIATICGVIAALSKKHPRAQWRLLIAGLSIYLIAAVGGSLGSRQCLGRHDRSRGLGEDRALTIRGCG